MSSSLSPTQFYSSEVRTYACALNNMGAAMLLRGQYAAAAATLKDALFIMLHHREQAKCNDFGFLYHAQEKTLAASCFLSQITSEPEKIWTPFCVRTVECHDIASLQKASLEDLSNTSFTAVLIRDPCVSLKEHRINYDRESGLVLYNYGLSCYLLQSLNQQATCAAPVKTEELMKQDSIRSLVLSHTTFANILFECDEARHDLGCVFMAMLVLSCTSKIFAARNEVAKASEAQDAVDTLLAAIEEDVHMCQQAEHFQAAAAA